MFGKMCFWNQKGMFEWCIMFVLCRSCCRVHCIHHVYYILSRISNFFIQCSTSPIHSKRIIQPNTNNIFTQCVNYFYYMDNDLIKYIDI